MGKWGTASFPDLSQGKKKEKKTSGRTDYLTDISLIRLRNIQSHRFRRRFLVIELKNPPEVNFLKII